MADDLSHAMRLLREQRHGFLNHLQVISGWLQLGKSDRAAEYLDRVAARMDAEGTVLRQAQSPAVALFVLEAALQAEPFGVAIDWQVTGPVDIGALAAARVALLQELSAASNLPEERRRIVVALGRTIRVHRPSAEGEG